MANRTGIGRDLNIWRQDTAGRVHTPEADDATTTGARNLMDRHLDLALESPRWSYRSQSASSSRAWS